MQPPWHPVGLLLNLPKSSQSNVSYVSYESRELCKTTKKTLQASLKRLMVVIADAKTQALEEMKAAKAAQPKVKACAKTMPSRQAEKRRRLRTPKAI